jgi:hypothetical protein
MVRGNECRPISLDEQDRSIFLERFSGGFLQREK